jgi:AcrR family transcriptional regulator
MATAPTRRGTATAPRERAEHLGPERRRPLVLDAALKLFVEHGYRGTSMDAIAEAAGVTKPVVYDCYASKEKLFRALLEREERRLLAEIETAIPADPDYGDVEGLLRDAFSGLLAAAARAPDSWRVLFVSEHAADPLIARRVRRSRDAIVGRVVQLVEAYLATVGVADPQRKAPVLGELLVSIAEGGVRAMLASKGDWKPEELGALLSRMALSGVAAA